jgi:chromosome partitioning protein
MTAKKSPKTIAAINFKGGVGKTTVTWCIGDLLATYGSSNVLLFDLDAQMSLTQAISLNEQTGQLYNKFGKWFDECIQKKKTIFNAIEKYTDSTGHFDFSINYTSIYQLNERFHFVPSVEDLYWMELDVFDRTLMKTFIRDLLGKVTYSDKVASYDYALFDCPPSFTLLSYSVLSVCDLILIPLNPDFFAVKGIPLILNTLKMRIEPFPIPKIAVFMNKAKPYAGRMTKETEFYWRSVKTNCQQVAKEHGIKVKCMDSVIFERVGIKRAITEGMPSEFVPDFQTLWKEITTFLRE